MAQEQFNDNLVSSRQSIIKKYDVNGDGVFDTNEINCIMDDFMFMTQTNKSLADTNSNQKKLLIGTFSLIILLSISNLGTALLAVNMSKEVVVVDGKIMANGGSQEEAISTMKSVRNFSKSFPESTRLRDRHRRILHTVEGDNSALPEDDGDTSEVVCFTEEEVESFLASAMNGSGTNLVLSGQAEDGSSSTTVIPINGAATVADNVYSFSNVEFALVDIESCVGEDRRNLQEKRNLAPKPDKEFPQFGLKPKKGK